MIAFFSEKARVLGAFFLLVRVRLVVIFISPPALHSFCGRSVWYTRIDNTRASASVASASGRAVGVYRCVRCNAFGLLLWRPNLPRVPPRPCTRMPLYM